MDNFVLILTTDVFTSISLEDGLIASGCATRTAVFVEEAQNILSEHREKIIGIIYDLDFEFLEHRNIFPEVPIILITSGEEKSHNKQSIMMRKPVSPEKIIDTINEIFYTIKSHQSLTGEQEKACIAG